jgi:hypothetical protein
MDLTENTASNSSYIIMYCLCVCSLLLKIKEAYEITFLSLCRCIPLIISFSMQSVLYQREGGD